MHIRGRKRVKTATPSKRHRNSDRDKRPGVTCRTPSVQTSHILANGPRLAARLRQLQCRKSLRANGQRPCVKRAVIHRNTKVAPHTGYYLPEGDPMKLTEQPAASAIEAPGHLPVEPAPETAIACALRPTLQTLHRRSTCSPTTKACAPVWSEPALPRSSRSPLRASCLFCRGPVPLGPTRPIRQLPIAPPFRRVCIRKRDAAFLCAATPHLVHGRFSNAVPSQPTDSTSATHACATSQPESSGASSLLSSLDRHASLAHRVSRLRRPPALRSQRFVLRSHLAERLLISCSGGGDISSRLSAVHPDPRS